MEGKPLKRLSSIRYILFWVGKCGIKLISLVNCIINVEWVMVLKEVVVFDKKTKSNRSPVVACIVRLGVTTNGIFQKMRFLTLLNRFNKTWLGELLSIYRWKEVWVVFSLPVFIFVLPALWLCLLFTIPGPWNAILFWTSFVGLVAGSVWGNPLENR